MIWNLCKCRFIVQYVSIHIQVALFARIRKAAKSLGIPSPHMMLYANSVYNWPFDKITGLGLETVSLHGIDGNVHAETNDGGIYPSYFIDHSRQSGQEAFLSIFKNHIYPDGGADGVYLDCFAQNPIGCKPPLRRHLQPGEPRTCVAQRNHYIPTNKNLTETSVDPKVAAAYLAGHATGLSAATKIVENSTGGMFTVDLAEM